MLRYAFFEAGRAVLALDNEAELERTLAVIGSLTPAQTPPAARGVALGFQAILASRHGNHDDAIAGFEPAIAGLRAIGQPFEVAWALLERGIALLRAGREDEAAGSLAEARGIYETLGAPRWIDRVDQVLERESVTA